MGRARTGAGAHRGRLALVLGISTVIFLLEVVAGILTNSLALLADAGHVFTDMVGVSLALGAIWLASRPVSDARTFGYYRAEILAAVLNAVLLFGIAAYVLVEAVRRLQEPPEIASGAMLAVAVVGLAANLFSAWLLREARQQSLNMRGAFLEVLTDALGSAAVIAAALVIATTGFVAADAVASAFIGLLIVPRTWALLREAVDVLLEATPKGVALAHVRQHILEAPGVADVHDLHVWTITSGMNVVSAHVVVGEGTQPAEVLRHLATCLRDDFDIEHSTFQLETPDHRRLEEATHP